MRAILIAAALLLPVSTPAAREVTLRSQCYGDRCVYYRPDGRRVGSVTDYGNGRVVLRDNSGRRIGTVTVRGGRATYRRP